MTQKIVRLSGELDHHSAAPLKEKLDTLIKSGGKGLRLVLDFRDVTLMDSSGIGLIIGRYKLLKNGGGALAVQGLNQQIDKVFRLSGLYRIIKKINGGKKREQ